MKVATDLDKARDRLDKKRAELRKAKAARANAQATVADEIDAASLAAEEARLDVQLNAAKADSTVTNVRKANQSNLQAAKAQLAGAAGNPVVAEQAGTDAANDDDKKKGRR